MNNERLEVLLRKVVGGIKGRPGHWEFAFEGHPMYCFSDESYDRMRIIAPIADLKDLPGEALGQCMEANFDRTLDVRYCVFQEHLWSAFIHPLSELSDEFLDSALRQLANSVKNFGGSYTSGVLVFTPAQSEGG